MCEALRFRPAYTVFEQCEVVQPGEMEGTLVRGLGRSAFFTILSAGVPWLGATANLPWEQFLSLFFIPLFFFFIYILSLFSFFFFCLDWGST